MTGYFILFLLFFSIVNIYIGYNGWVWLKTTPLRNYKKTYIAIFLFLSLSYMIGRFTHLNFLSLIGSYWLAIFGYSLIILPLANILVLLLKKRGGFWIGTAVLIFFAGILGIGSYKAWSPVVMEYNIELQTEGEETEVKILFAADLHLGDVVGKNHLRRFVSIVHEQEPDLILLGGDIIEDYVDPYLARNMDDLMEQLAAPLGFYAAVGNHEYYGNQLHLIVQALEQSGVIVLMDETVNVNDLFYITGRKDRHDRGRAPISNLIRDLDPILPIVMLDHQPSEIAEANQQGVDLILSGHTHRGQVFPGNYVTARLFDNDYGHFQEGDFHSIVTSGFGTWGPPLRIGTRSEVTLLRVNLINALD